MTVFFFLSELSEAFKRTPAVRVLFSVIHPNARAVISIIDGESCVVQAL